MVRARFQEWVRKGPHLYVITAPHLYGMDHHRIAELAFSNGVKIVQIRDKTSPDRLLYEEIKRSLNISRYYEGFLIINDRIDLVLATGADGVHVGQEDLPPAVARRLLGENKIVGLSTHTKGEFDAAQREPVDYVAFGPVYPTSTKPEYRSPGIEQLREVVDRATKPVCAIGGITLERIKEVLAAGVMMVAVISDLTHGDPGERIRMYQAAISNFR